MVFARGEEGSRFLAAEKKEVGFLDCLLFVRNPWGPRQHWLRVCGNNMAQRCYGMIFLVGALQALTFERLFRRARTL